MLYAVAVLVVIGMASLFIWPPVGERLEERRWRRRLRQRAEKEGRRLQ
jgi:F0F1-type ATP synthase membrane subunit b/b'